jgi:glycosyltransferase involved in cell wall biosynthesis
VFNVRAELGRLITNLVPFRNKEVELIVIDGGSTDGSINYLTENSNDIDFWLSEPDNGIYDAMNKGLSAARGTYIIHINAGDRLLELPLAQLTILAQRQVDVVCCRVLEDESHLFIPRNDWLLRFDNTWHHQGTFYRRAAHMGYNPSYKVFGDFDHNQRMSKAGRSVESLDIIVASHESDGVSRNNRSRREIFRSIRNNFGIIHLAPAFARFQLLKLRALARRKVAETS